MLFSRKPITNAEYKFTGVCYFVAAYAIGGILKASSPEMLNVGTMVFLALSALMGLISFATKPNRLVNFLGFSFLALGISFDASVRKAAIEEPWGFFGLSGGILCLFILGGLLTRPMASSTTAPKPDAEPETPDPAPPEDE